MLGNEVQSWKHRTPKLVTLDGIVMLVNEAQLAKQEVPKLVTIVPIDTDCNGLVLLYDVCNITALDEVLVVPSV